MTPFVPDPTDPLALLGACPAHAPTPLRTLSALATRRGWGTLHAKDETARMGLGSFKALGGAYAVACELRARVEAATGRRPCPAELTGDAARRIASELTFTCASAGNHGLAVAAGARVFGARAAVYLAASVDEAFAERLRGRGATVVRAGAVYDDATAAAREAGDAPGHHLLADASWPGHVEPPARVMTGYAVIGEELRAAFEASGHWPTHVALQAGVGGMAAAIAAHVRARWAVQPEILVVEPDAAPCLRDSLAAGRPVRADGPVSTQGRLDCKEPSHLAFEILRDADVRCVTVSDALAEAAADELAGEGLATTPSGAAGLAGLDAADLPPGARPLILVTEGPP